MSLIAPIRRPLPVRLLLTAALCVLYAWRKLRLPNIFVRKETRAIVANWTDPMFRILIRSRVTRAYPDQTCSLRKPADAKPLVAVEGPNRLTDEDVRLFYDNGYLPPFDAFPEREIRAFGDEILAARERPSSIYGFKTDRDRHLEMPRMLGMLQNAAILDRCAQLLGPDLLCWRSQFFYKPPRGEAVQWHQASSYMVEDGALPALVPPDRDALFQLTVWVAVDPAHKANGCLRLVPGSADAIRPIVFGGDEGFYHARYRLDYDFDHARVDYLEARPGQAIIFCERTIHGSSANATDQSRSAFNFRVIRPDTRVYPDKRVHRAMHMDQTYDLNRWGCVLLRGEDRYGVNRLVPGAPPDTDP